MSHGDPEISEEELSAIERLESAASSVDAMIARLRDVRKTLGGPPDSCGGERARRLSVAITHLETARLWIDHANGI